jgi:hypothetical protein
MQNRTDSSLWKSLAVAFGDGLAFGVGVKLSQNAPRLQAGAAAPPRPGNDELAGRLADVEQAVKRMERVPVTGTSGMDQKVLEAIVNALEARLKEHASQVERRMADFDARFALELKSLDDQDHEVAKKVTEDLNALESQVIKLHREFGEAVAQIVADQVTAQVSTQVPAQVATQVASQLEARAVALERSLETRMMTAINTAVNAAVNVRVDPLEWKLREEIARRDGEIAVLTQELAEVDIDVEEKLSSMVAARVEPLERELRLEIAEKDRAIADLRRQLGDADQQVLELVNGIGMICRQAAERIVRSSAPVHGPVPATMSAAPEPEVAAAETDTESEADAVSVETPPPGFTQPQKPSRLWRVPLVSSLVVAISGGLVLAHYL